MNVEPAVVAAAAEDFGHVLRGAPAGVIQPRTRDEVAHVVTDAAASGRRLTLRGHAHSAGGQALPVDSLVLDLTGLNQIGAVDRQEMTITCGAGTLLRDVVAATTPHGLLPRALTNLLDLTVGGILGVGGGIGQGSHRFGPLAANVVRLQVVTADGVLRMCSPNENSDLFDAVVGGLGRCGVIVSADLQLRQVKPHIRTFYLLYDDVQRWMNDQVALARAGVDAMEGFCSPSVQGLRGIGGRRSAFAEWFFPLQIAVEFDDVEPELPDWLSPYRVLHSEDDAIEFFARRHDPRFEMVRRLGAWERPHPYISAFVGAANLAEALPDVLDALPLYLGDANRGAFFMAADAAPRLMALPDTDDVVFFNVIYPQVLPQFLDDALRALQKAADVLVAAGGKRYVADWLGPMNDGAWQAHFGDAYDWWVESKRRFDPDGVFCSLLLE